MQDSKPEPKAVVRDLGELLSGIIARHLPEYERVIGLPSGNQEFHEKVVDAVKTCIFRHMLDPRGPRPSQMRKDLLQASDAARKAHDGLCTLNAALDALPESVLHVLERYWGNSGEIARRFIENEVSWLRAAESLTRASAKAFGDKGGRPEMLGFRGLAEGLAKAFKAGTGKTAKVYWSEIDHCWRGDFLKLVVAVLPLVEKLAGATERPFQAPQSPVALGQYLHSLTRANTRNRNRQRAK